MRIPGREIEELQRLIAVWENSERAKWMLPFKKNNYTDGRVDGAHFAFSKCRELIETMLHNLPEEATEPPSASDIQRIIIEYGRYAKS